MSLTTSVEHEVRAGSRARSAVTTPDWLRIGSVVVAVALVALAAVSVGVVVSHRRSVDAILQRSAPLVVAAQDLYVALAAADAAASTGLLQTGAETPELRAEYHEQLAAAGEHLVTIAAEQDLSSTTRASVETIAGELQEYAGLVELARANTLQGFPVGAAYLRHASDLMREQILPAAKDVYTDAAHELDEHYRDGTSRTPLAALVVGAVIVLALLVVTQVFVARRSRRVFNPGLLLATLLVIVLAVVAVALVESQHRSLSSSRTTGSDPLLYASTSRILLLRSRSDENLYLIERLTDSPHAGDFDTVVAGLGGTDGTSGSINGVADSSTAAETATARTIAETYVRYLALHEDVRAAAARVSFDSAATIAVGAQADAAAELDTALDRNVEAAQANLRSAAEAADDRLRPLLWVALLLPLVAAAAAVAGIERRIREYR